MEQSVPVGCYVNADFFSGGFRIAADGNPIVRFEVGEAFDPRRTQALLLWTEGGWVEYAFSNYFAKENIVRELRISLEICSETALYRNDWKSDVTFSVNGRELCTWTCPGDYGGTRGRLNPDWWPISVTQFGDLVTLTVNGEGTFLNHVRAGDVNLADLKLGEGDRLLFSLGNKRDAVHVGGFNLFGRKMGNYEQDIVLTAVCEHRGEEHF